MAGLLTITVEPLGARMAGPAIRALELSRAVAASTPARVVSLTGCERPDDGDLQLFAATGPGLRRLVEAADCLLIQGDVLGLEPWIADLPVPIVVDVYDPFHLEQLEQARPLGEARRRAVVRDCITALNRQLARADLVLAASTRQRDLWLGHLAALGRINPVTYDDRHDLSGLLAVVPFGLPATPPTNSGRPRIRTVFPGVDADSVVALWSGGIYDWFDPELVVRAVAAARRTDPRLQLVMMGLAHPVLGSPSSAETRMLAIATDLGLLGSGVHLAPGWIPYSERADWLTEADIGVLAHHPGVESEFAFRTRLLDHLWAGLPTVGTGGDLLTDLIVGAGAGRSVPAGDADAFAAALLELAGSAAARSAAATATVALAGTLHWDVAARPLIEFCRTPRRAPDLRLGAADRALLGVGDPAGRRPSLVDRGRAAIREGGPRLLATRLTNRLRRPGG